MENNSHKSLPIAPVFAVIGAILAYAAVSNALADFAITNTAAKHAAEDKAAFRGFVWGLLAIVCLAFTFLRGSLTWRVIAALLSLPAWLIVLNFVI